MTPSLRLDWTMPEDRLARLTVQGDLDFTCAAQLLDTVTARLSEHPSLRGLHVDCAGLSHCDSYGLSMLLMAHRRALAAGVAFRLDNRSTALDRMLELTGTVEHLTADTVADDHSQSS
ncbi:STAS domain-containing protein [Kutzneria sp. NPDC052558]|uniref:STAS domain-containing protein n=1 Tax=Kutzneria sp. NPDC052558 TaxID=3364121 RepID=UPI0037CA20AA